MTKNRIAKVSIEQIGIDEDVLFNLMTHDAKYDFYALRPDEVTELQNSIKAMIDDRDRLKQANAALLEALTTALNQYEELGYIDIDTHEKAELAMQKAAIEATNGNFSG